MIDDVVMARFEKKKKKSVLLILCNATSVTTLLCVTSAVLNKVGRLPDSISSVEQDHGRHNAVQHL